MENIIAVALFLSGAGLTGGFFGLTTFVLAGRRERKNWLRDQKLKAFIDLENEMSIWQDKLDQSSIESIKWETKTVMTKFNSVYRKAKMLLDPIQNNKDLIIALDSLKLEVYNYTLHLDSGSSKSLRRSNAMLTDKILTVRSELQNNLLKTK